MKTEKLDYSYDKVSLKQINQHMEGNVCYGKERPPLLKRITLKKIINLILSTIKGVFIVLLFSPVWLILFSLMYLRILFLKNDSNVIWDKSSEEDVFNRMYSKWGQLPFAFMRKWEETLLFSKVDTSGSSIEIGVSNGLHSALTFENKKIKIGIEYVPSVAIECIENASDIFENVMCGDIYELPLKSNSIDSIILVNMIDDITRGPEKALDECYRVLKPDGKLYYSGFTETFKKNHPLHMLDSSGKLFDNLYKGIHNFFDEKDWRIFSEKSGFNVVDFKYIIPTSFDPLWKVGVLVERKVRQNINADLQKYLFKVFNLIVPLASIYRYVLKNIMMKFYTRGDEAGNHFFCIVEKDCDENNDFRVINSEKFEDIVSCPCCKDSNLDFSNKDNIVCADCGSRFIFNEVLLLHPEFCNERKN